MKCTTRTLLNIRHLSLLAIVGLPCVHHAWAQRYWIEELAPVPPYIRSFGLGINDVGVVIGASDNGAWIGPATRWVNGVPESLGSLPGWVRAWAFDVSNNGNRSVGQATLSGDSRVPVIWENLVPTELPTPPGLDGASGGQINDAGSIVGWSWNFSSGLDEACRWDFVGNEWVLTLLPHLPGDAAAQAAGLNQDGVIVGWSGDLYGADVRACRWESGIPSVPPGLENTPSSASGINDLGQIAGDFETAPGGPWHAFYHDGTAFIAIGPPAGSPYPNSFAWRINNGPTVVGWTYANGVTFFSLGNLKMRAFVWRNGALAQVNDLLVGGSGWDVKQAWDINKRGQIAGTGVLAGKGWRACRLTPAYGDLNCDGAVNAFDIDPFVLALTDPTGYAAAYPNCDLMNGDINCDGAVNAFDIDPFVQCLTTGCPACP